MDAMTRQDEELEIDLLELFGVLLGRWWLLLLSLVAGAVLSLAVTLLFITPQYEATAMIYIFSKSTSITSLADIQLGSSLAVDFELIGVTREVMERVIAEMGLDMDYEELLENVEVENPTSSHMLRITVKDPDAQQAADISNALAEILREQVAEVMNTDKPSMVERAVVEEDPASPNVLVNTLVGGLVFFLIAALAVTVRFVTDDTICTDEDVKKYLGLEMLAAFPVERS